MRHATGLRIERADDPRVAAFRDLAGDPALRAQGSFVAESRVVVARLLRGGRHPVCGLLATPGAYRSLAPTLALHPPAGPGFVAEPEVLDEIVGFAMHQGCVALARRGATGAADAIIGRAVARRAPLVVLENVGDPDNLGAIFRNARAFGAAGVLLSPGGCDPLYRKAIRVSLGATFELPSARLSPWPEGLGRLREAGLRIVALSPGGDGIDIRRRAGTGPAALLLGSEGPGLSRAAVDLADQLVRIPVAAGSDSLNVASASAIALFALS